MRLREHRCTRNNTRSPCQSTCSRARSIRYSSTSTEAPAAKSDLKSAEKDRRPVPEHEHVQPPMKQRMHEHEHGSNSRKKHHK